MNRFLVVVFVVLATSVAHAAEPKLAAITKAYADKNGLPVRIVKNDLGTRQVERHFVPVLPTTHADFVATFAEANGAMIWKTRSDKVHGMVSFGPNDLVSYNDRHKDNLNILPHSVDSQYLVLALDKSQSDSWKGFIDRHMAAGNNTPWGGLGHYQAEIGKPVFGGCVWWVVNADVGGGLNLAHLMGVRRAKGPEVLAPRLIHAGNHLVGPIGIAVASVEQFNAMTDQQLLGPEPAGGAAEQVKE